MSTGEESVTGGLGERALLVSAGMAAFFVRETASAGFMRSVSSGEASATGGLLLRAFLRTQAPSDISSCREW